jgi:putative salt-induced outer membrane protein
LILLSACAALLPTTATHAEIPPPVEAMIREAARSGDQATVDAVVKVARITNPQDQGAIDALAKMLMAETREQTKREREQRLAAQHYFEGWSGQGQAGFGLTSGNTREVSGVIGLSLNKEGLKTRHKLEALVDYLRTNNVTTREKFGASYSLEYLLREGFYSYGIMGWEQDRFAGYARRFTESFGIGLRVVNRPDMTLDLDAGPAFRQTLFTDSTSVSDAGPRASINYKWTLSKATTFTQIASIISAEGRTTFTSNTAFTSKITKALSGRLSINVQSESNRPEGSKPTDTATRATFVYEF